MNSKVDKDTEQILQMYNMEGNKTALKTLMADTYGHLDRLNLNETATDHLHI